MSCRHYENKRKSFINIKGLAEKCLIISDDSIVIYEIERGVFGFCREKDFTEKKGIFKIRLQKHPRNKPV